MGWYKRNSKRYYFRSQRNGDTVEKIYFGSGPVAELASCADSLKQHEIEQIRQCWKQDKALIEEAFKAFDELDWLSNLLCDATLLAAGFHRPSLHKWRPWFHGRRILKQDC